MKKYFYPFLVISVFSVIFWCLPSYFGRSSLFQRMSMDVRDLFFKIRHASQGPPAETQNVVFATVDEVSCQKTGFRWPWPRSVFAKLVEGARRTGTRVIALNFTFTGFEGEGSASSFDLSNALHAHGNAVVGATFDRSGRLVAPSAILTQSGTRVAFLEKIVDSDYKIRRSYLLRRYGKGMSGQNFESSFPLEVLMAYLKGESPAGRPFFDEQKQLVRLDKLPSGLYVNGDGSYTINFLAAESDFRKVPAWKLVEGVSPDADLRGKVLFVGLGSSLFSDIHPTPLGILSGMGIHANEFLAAITGRQLRFVPDFFTFLIAWLGGLCVLWLFLLRRFWLGFLAFGLCFFGFFLGAQALFFKDILMEPFILLTGPSVAMLVGVVSNSLKLLLENRGLEEKAIRDKLTGLYKYEYLRERLEEEWKHCQKSGLPVSLVMADLDRFKPINDTLGHEVGNQMIRRAARVIQECARNYDLVSRYGGDEFMVLLWHSGHSEAEAYRNRLREAYAVMAHKLEYPMLRDSSVSIGVATYDPRREQNPVSTQQLIEWADKDLYEEKRKRS